MLHNYYVLGISAQPLGQWIPAGLSYAHASAFMNSECSENGIPEEGITVFGSLLHQHTIGTAIKYRHIRDGKELAPIETNLNYDFNYQQATILHEPIKLLPGDELILDCWTDSSERDHVTIGGEASSEEMCAGFLLYYPMIEMLGAFVMKTPFALKTWMKDAAIAGYMNGTEADIDGIFANANETDFSSLPISYDSTIDGALEFYNRLYSVEYEEYNQHYMVCYGEDGIMFNDKYANITRDESFEAYDLGIDECDNYIHADNNNDIGVCVPTESNTENKSGIKPFISGIIFIILLVLCQFC